MFFHFFLLWWGGYAPSRESKGKVYVNAVHNLAKLGHTPEKTFMASRCLFWWDWASSTRKRVSDFFVKMNQLES
jgi:hypothetical protein